MKILYVVSNLRLSNGVTAVAMSAYDALIAAGYRVDFCALYSWGSHHVRHICQNGGRCFLLPQRSGPAEMTEDDSIRAGAPDPDAAAVYLNRLMAQERYDIVHIHIVGRYAYLAALAAKRNGVPCRVLHCHNPKHIRNARELASRLRFDLPAIRCCNRFLACSQDAGRSFFGGRPFRVLKNTIDISRFRFDPAARAAIRKELGIGEGSTLFGTVCRQSYQKNPFFTVEIFAALHRRLPDSRFLWVGTGPQEQAVREYAAARGVLDAMHFAGTQSEPWQFDSAMDVFLLPSLFEGLGIVFLEAQSCGAVVYASDAVPGDTAVTELMHRLPLSRPAEFWADAILRTSLKAQHRGQYAERIAHAGWAQTEEPELLECYRECCGDQ